MNGMAVLGELRHARAVERDAAADLCATRRAEAAALARLWRFRLVERGIMRQDQLNALEGLPRDTACIIEVLRARRRYLLEHWGRARRQCE